MNENLAELHGALRERLGVVADHKLRDEDPKAHLEKLIAAAGRLDDVVGRMPAGTDPMLRHYLERQSYVKALAWLEENQ